MIDLNQPEIKFALNAVRQAAQLVQHVQSEMVTPALSKDDRSPVTVADFACQALIGHLVDVSFPDDPLVAEENSAVLQQPQAIETLEAVTQFTRPFVEGANHERVCQWIDYGRVDTAARFWTLDPVDGTKGFLRGDQYALALALVIDGLVEIGVLGCPHLADAFRPDQEGYGSIVIAARGQGAWFTEMACPGHYEPLYVSTRSNPADARIFRSFEVGHTNVEQIDAFSRLMQVRAEPIRMDSQAKYSILSAGKGDILLRLLSAEKPDYKEKIWDHAAGSLILEEAGGRITDLDGKPLDFTTGRSLLTNRGILATNNRLHEAALKALAVIHA